MNQPTSMPSQATASNPVAPTYQKIPCGDFRPGEAPTIRLEREGDQVKVIHLTCTCGTTTRLLCSYDASGS